ncbi:MAG: LacI family transcriptional regulator [Lactobacillales bacterium]|jgi:LacI family transcriptional regulator|nr:LacI family transcriptional regulator [Lactobacillales bacterium]
MSATIRDVAKASGVSVGTVSRYLNGHVLKKENMKKIEEAIKTLNFEENMIAKGLRHKKTRSIGVLINSLTDVFATSIVTYLENYLEERNYTLILGDYQNDYNRLEKKLEFLKSRSVDGVVVFHLEHKLPVLEKYKEDKIPVIAVDSPIRDFVTDVVVVNNHKASYEAIGKLIEKGHEEIGIIAGTQDRYIGYNRLEGAVKKLEEFHLYNPKMIKIGDYLQESGYKLTKELLQENPEITALYTMNYYMTLGAVQALLELRKKIPEDISIIGFDNFALTDIIQPKLTVVAQPVQKIGETVGKLILEDIEAGEFTQNKQVHLETEFLLGDSVENRITQ